MADICMGLHGFQRYDYSVKYLLKWLVQLGCITLMKAETFGESKHLVDDFRKETLCKHSCSIQAFYRSQAQKEDWLKMAGMK